MTNTLDRLSSTESVSRKQSSVTPKYKIETTSKHTIPIQPPFVSLDTEETRVESRAEGRRRLRKTTRNSRAAESNIDLISQNLPLESDSNGAFEIITKKQLSSAQKTHTEQRRNEEPRRNSKPFPYLLRSNSASTTLTSRFTMSYPPPSRAVVLLIASLGNPPPYHSTRHSAAHVVLKNLQSNLALPPFINKYKPYGGGHVSLGAEVGKPEFTLWQSPSLMNVSGTALLQAYKQFLNVHRPLPSDPIWGLVVLHDEMEIEPGRFKVRRGGNTSAKGHNGIKSVQGSLSGGGLLNGLDDRFVKIGIGIGRPSGGSRESKDVSAYVLGQLTSKERDGLESVAKDIEGVLHQEMRRMIQKQK